MIAKIWSAWSPPRVLPASRASAKSWLNTLKPSGSRTVCAMTNATGEPVSQTSE